MSPYNLHIRGTPALTIPAPIVPTAIITGARFAAPL